MDHPVPVPGQIGIVDAVGEVEAMALESPVIDEIRVGGPQRQRAGGEDQQRRQRQSFAPAEPARLRHRPRLLAGEGGQDLPGEQVERGGGSQDQRRAPGDPRQPQCGEPQVQPRPTGERSQHQAVEPAVARAGQPPTEAAGGERQGGGEARGGEPTLPGDRARGAQGRWIR